MGRSLEQRLTADDSVFQRRVPARDRLSECWRYSSPLRECDRTQRERRRDPSGRLRNWRRRDNFVKAAREQELDGAWSVTVKREAIEISAWIRNKDQPVA